MAPPRTCTCMSCRKCYERERARKVYELRAQERWEPHGDLDAVVEHLKWLQAQRVGFKAIHLRTGIATSTLGRIRRGQNKSVTKAVADAILAITPTDGGLLPAVGTRRRIQALGRIGWSTYYIADRLGTRQNVVWELSSRRRYVTRRTEARIRDLYDELSMTIGPSATTIRRAIASGWEPPLAWDDIDDPNERPGRMVEEGEPLVDENVVERILAGEKLPANRAEKYAVIDAWLARGGSANGLEGITGWSVWRMIRDRERRAA